MKEYDHNKIEKKWQKIWEEKKVYKTLSSAAAKGKKPFYVLDMFPYPSGAGLHVGHPRGYIGSDVLARQKRMAGFNVLHPMGYDAFGLPAEQYAIANNIHPKKAVDINVKTFEKQLGIMGLSYDWSRKVNTTDPEYYKWTEWIFLKIYNSWFDVSKNKARPIEELVKIFEKKGNTEVNAFTNYDGVFSAAQWKAMDSMAQQNMLMKYRLAYEGNSEVNWCPHLGTVLANDEIVDSPEGPVSERGGYPVEKKSMRQWFMRITAYGERLISDLDALEWPESVKEVQKNWIGKSEGSEIEFKIVSPGMQKILVGTRNEAKFKMVKECFPEMEGVELISLNDIAAVDDSMLVEGNDFEENARMKAEFYFKKTGIPTISTDNVFWVEKWKKDNGVMVHMRKEANPKSPRATDEEVIEFLKKWLGKVGGKSKAHFIYAFAYADGQGVRSASSTQREYILQQKQSANFWPGYPTEVLLIDAKTKEYKGDQKNSVRYDRFIADLNLKMNEWLAGTKSIKVFTTRADTLFGVTYVVLAPEHTLVETLKSKASNKADIEHYVNATKKKDDIARTSTDKEKTGVELKGITAINPANGEQVPVWIADYVLGSYGTGAVMAVPAHDERDYLFANKFNLPVVQVVAPHNIDKENPPRSGKKNTTRDIIHAIVEHPSENKIISLKWKNFPWHTFITGGIEEGEDAVTAAMREVMEETGYKNMEFVKRLPYQIFAEFYAAHKDVNRAVMTNVIHFKLKDLEQNIVEKNEQDLHEVVWRNFSEIGTFSPVSEIEHIVKWIKEGDTPFCGDGILIASGDFSGMSSEDARTKITKFVGGKIVTKYKFRDAIFARQRYWGEPIPLFKDKNGIIQEVSEKKLPLVLPNVKSYEPTGTGESPLASVPAWTKAGYETNTMPGWAGSSWYFLRYFDPKNKKAFADKKEIDYWFSKKRQGGVDVYVGGAEHTTGHLMYSRFWHKVLFDYGLVPTKEPFQVLRNQGMILASDGRKMSKRWGNVINPDDIVKTYGADTLRLYEMFMGPFESTLPWSTESIIGSRRFIERVWRFAQKIQEQKIPKNAKSTCEMILHKTIKKVTEDIENFSFNTAVSNMMICLNEMEKSAVVTTDDLKNFLKILAPFAPHVTEDIWTTLGEKKSINVSGWPKYDESKLVSETATIVVQVNGKFRATIIVKKDSSQEEIEALAKQDEKVKAFLGDGNPQKVIYVPNRLINFVV